MNVVTITLRRKYHLFKNAVFFLAKRSAGTAPAEAKFRTKEYHLHLLESGPSTLVNLTRDDALKFYRQMILIRKMEEEIDKLYIEEEIRGSCHNCMGEEALSIGVEGAIEPGDLVMGGYRNHGWVYTRGLSVREIIAELLGRKTGCAKGKGGSMHLQAHNFLCTPILGSQVSVGTGFAFALKYRQANNVALAVYGDGAANQGQVYESFNMAKLWDLPVIYVCENNQVAMNTPVSRASASTSFHNKVNFIPGIQADGADVLAVREATRFCREYCLAGKGPIILELVCYRFKPHTIRFPGHVYRSEQEVQKARETLDPVPLFTQRLLARGLADEATLKDIDLDAEKEVRQGIEAARSDPIPHTRDAFTDVYFDPPMEFKVRGCDSWTMHDAM
ncbi:pyruvate dehydrogenase E1 component subunit alpha, mitochondrial-like [Ptychodera flava]|uniref:pyruvate dehydrogenase E1 component subunit alpha, mitochondrial-like n=1 Tax=Ptychodera flava TaxID=63121 RepID=UPI00396AA3DB